MKHVFTTAAALALGTVAALADGHLSGDTVTAESVVDVTEIIRIADALDVAVDAKQWEQARAYFVDTIDIDFTSLTGGDPATIPAGALVAGWSGNLTAEKTSFHLRGNHQVTFTDVDNAVLFSHGYAWNRMERGGLAENGGDPLWEVWGTYEHGFVRTEDGWQINAMSFNATVQRGNAFVRDTPGS